ncbi:hypothetical protein VTN00DRAFT_1838 [Thermoascus crustaceus]|uniref:uncharacterized protein n=1 Tax=Thermoascus crustaceus TaxID=5088 RepID=UPI003742B0BD
MSRFLGRFSYLASCQHSDDTTFTTTIFLYFGGWGAFCLPAGVVGSIPWSHLSSMWISACWEHSTVLLYLLILLILFVCLSVCTCTLDLRPGYWIKGQARCIEPHEIFEPCKAEISYEFNSTNPYTSVSPPRHLYPRFLEYRIGAPYHTNSLLTDPALHTSYRRRQIHLPPNYRGDQFSRTPS